MFDLPFIRHEFSDIQIPSVHIDLRFLAKRIDLSGGQKHIESILGFKRPKSLANMAGENAPVLWHQYRRGDDAAMRLLLQYNHADIEGMKWIFDHVTRELLKRSGLPATRARTAPRFFSRREFFTESRRIANDTQGVQSYRGRVGPSVLLSQLDTDHFGTPLRVVGIDLTGSQTKPSGWCALAGGEVETRTIASDDDLVAQTLAVNPHIISIDSPLSLPRGRISVSDDDPGRVEFGIMRQSERALKKRGVNVYPALIPSMQKLTARGIRLAARFRALGFPTIESYPGAAQDIMGIPRKRSSLTMLRSGLAEFGLSGSFLAREVSHDELDAITSAVVGAFFWSGQFESLGEEAEEALIIPDLSPKDSAQKRIVIGISGRIAAGKTTAAKLLGEEDFAYGRYSMVVESMLGESDKTGGRDILQKRGMELHRDHGQRWLGRQLLALLPKSGHLVIDGLRFPDDHAFLVETFGHSFLHLHLEAPEQLRRLRYDQRAGKSGDFFRAEAHPVEGAIDKLRELAHCVLRNDQGIDALHAQIKAKIQSSVR